MVLGLDQKTQMVLSRVFSDNLNSINNLTEYIIYNTYIKKYEEEKKVKLYYTKFASWYDGDLCG